MGAMVRLTLLAALAWLCACGSSSPPSCPTLLPPTHLFEGYCATGPGFCFFDQAQTF
jgi:hypothetical protein